MTYDLSTPLDRQRFSARAAYLLDKACSVELTEKTYRSGNQNRYLHALLGAMAIETGNSLDYVKVEYYKKLVNRSLFVAVKNDRFLGEVEVLRSSSDLTVEEMSESIDRFKRWAAENGCYLPDPEDEDRLKDIETEMGKYRKYL